jgi:hypothetical protein
MGLLVAPDSHGYTHTLAAITVLARVETLIAITNVAALAALVAITALPTLMTHGLSSDPYSPPAACLARHAKKKHCNDNSNHMSDGVTFPM